jgi:hypothetical protein
MKLIILAAGISLMSSSAMAAPVFKIEVGQDYTRYSDADLKRRVWELERAVWQLQQKVFDLESGKTQSSGATWICKTRAMGETFSAVGNSKAVAENDSLEKCKRSPKSGNGFHCSEAECSQ